MQVIGLFYGNSPMKLVVYLLASSSLVLSACHDQTESISPTQLGAGIGLQGSVISPLRFSNPYPQIPAQCYTETSRGAQNTCQYCHTNAVYKAGLGNNNPQAGAEPRIGNFQLEYSIETWLAQELRQAQGYSADWLPLGKLNASAFQQAPALRQRLMRELTAKGKHLQANGNIQGVFLYPPPPQEALAAAARYQQSVRWNWMIRLVSRIERAIPVLGLMTASLILWAITIQSIHRC